MSAGLTLFLMSEKGLRVLQGLVAEHASMIDCVVAARDESVAADFYDEIRGLCEQQQITFHDRAEFNAPPSAYAFAVSWRWLIDAPSSQLVVFHDSLLPRYRGFAPLVTALVNGDDEVGVTALLASEDYDAGDVVAQSKMRLDYPMRIQQVIEQISDLYAGLATELANQIAEQGELTATPQDHSQASYSLWRDEQDYRVDWNESAQRITRFVDAVGFPYKGALCDVGGKAARILQAEPQDDVLIENRTPGKVIFANDGFPVVVCGQGLLRITELQDRESGKSLLPLSRFRTRFT